MNQKIKTNKCKLTMNKKIQKIQKIQKIHKIQPIKNHETKKPKVTK